MTIEEPADRQSSAKPDERPPLSVGLRKTNIEVLRNVHGSLKWFWQLIMGFALVSAMTASYTAAFPVHAAQHRNYTPLILFPLIFIPMFIRFYFGDARYLDERYLEHREWQPTNALLRDLSKKLSRSRFWLDVLLLFMHGLMFLAMAQSITSFSRFFGAWSVLLILNTLYLAMSARLDRDTSTTTRSKPVRRTTILRIPRYHRFAPRQWPSVASYWWRNNVLAIVVSAPFLVFAYRGTRWSGTASTIALIAIAIFNSIADFWLTWEFYYPTLGPELDRHMRGRSTDSSQVG